MADGKVVIDTELDQKGLDRGMSEVESKAGKIFGGIGKAGATALKGAAVGIAATATAVGTLTGKSVQLYADYEQLTGGIDTLFKDSYGKVMEYADQAYKSAGLSANDYMDTVIGFSASLLQSLGGDTAKSAEIANQAVIDMSDNANKMGTSMDMIQHAYQGFAKQNYTMLDNLKLGYGGTKEEMQRLLDDAEKISGIKYDLSNFADVAQAIHVVQTEMGITGTTAKEASATISGSLNAMKSAWTNLITGMADENADMSTLMDNFSDSLATFFENVQPKIEEVLTGLVENLGYLAPLIIESLFSIGQEVLPTLIETVLNLITQMLTAIGENTDQIAGFVVGIVYKLSEIILQLAPVLLDVGMKLLTSLMQGFSENPDEMLSKIMELIETMTQIFIENAPMLIDAGLNLILALGLGLIEALPYLIEKVPEIIMAISGTLIDAIPKIVETGIKLFGALVQNLPAIIIAIVSVIPKIISSIKEKFNSFKESMKEIGLNLIKGIGDGIIGAKDWLVKKVNDLCGGAVDAIKNFFGIHSPATKHMPWLGRMMAAGLAKGFNPKELMSQITSDLKNGVGAIQSSIRFENNQIAEKQLAGITQYITIEREVESPDEMARAIRLESKYGLMRGAYA